MLSYCGLPCLSCPIHLATLEQDPARRQQLRADIALTCAERYGLRLSAADITDCDGCQAGGRLFSGCASCRIRPCAVARGVASCAYCEDYPCAILEQHLLKEPTARATLQELRGRRKHIGA